MIVTADSVTELREVSGAVLVAGSHGGIVAAHYASRAGVRAVILNDAGIGKDEAGIAGLARLDGVGMAAATVSHASARIGDGADTLARGVISRTNAAAARCGVEPGMRCHDAAVRLGRAPTPRVQLDPYEEGRHELGEGVLGVDSIGMLGAADKGRVLVIGSHCALHGGRPESALPVAALFAVFNDAGGLVSRLPVLAERSIAAAAVDCLSARIGDARSMWDTGMLSAVNKIAAALHLVQGMTVRAACAAVLAAQKKA